MVAIGSRTVMVVYTKLNNQMCGLTMVLCDE